MSSDPSTLFNPANDYILIGRVTTQATTIESMMDAYIAEFYTRCPNGGYQNPYLAFIKDVLGDKAMTLHVKKDILFKIHRRIHSTPIPRAVKTDFENWIGVRNKFAHGKYIDGRILFNGEFLDINVLAETHAKLQIEILAALKRFDELQGPYFNYIPTNK